MKAALDQRKHSLPLMIVSLLISLTLWAYVQHLSSGSLSYNVPVLVENKPDNLILTTELPTVDILATGPRELLDKIDPDEHIKAFIDLSDVEPGENPTRLTVYLNRRQVPTAIHFTVRDPSIAVTVEPRVFATKPVDVQVVGAAPEGYTVPIPTADPAFVEVSGLKDKVDSVDRVRAILDLNEVERGDDARLSLQAVDAQNREVTDVNLQPTHVTVRPEHVPAPPMKYVPITPTWSGQIPIGYRLAAYRVDPQQVRLTGSAEALSRLTVVETEPIDLNGVTANRTVRVRLKLPANVRSESGSRVSISLQIQKLPPPEPPPTQNNDDPPSTNGSP